MISPTLITSIAFPILFTANTYISYRSNSSIPRGGPLEPYLTACLYLIIQLPTLQYAWGIEPVLAKRLSSLAPPSARTIDMDEETKKRVDSVLVSHQTSCVFLLGTVLVPLIRLSRVYTPPKFGNEATGDGLYLKIGLWAAAAVSCGVCSYRGSAFFHDCGVSLTLDEKSGRRCMRRIKSVSLSWSMQRPLPRTRRPRRKL
jgi:hypothetical protein